MTTAPLRVALYSHDAKGLGHLRRNLALAHHLARALPGLTGRNVTGLVITGLAPGQEHRLPDGFDWLVLPGVKKAKGVYLPQRLRITREDLSLIRGALLSGVLSAFALICPTSSIDVVITDDGAPADQVEALRRAGVEVRLV